MSDKYYNTQVNYKKQSPRFGFIPLLTELYDEYIPLHFRKRHNFNRTKLSNIEIMSLMCFQVVASITNQNAFYILLVSLNVKNLPKRSRFNRRCADMGNLLQPIRVSLVKQVAFKSNYTIIDSFPISLFHSVRNNRAKALDKYANIGYNSTKK